MLVQGRSPAYILGRLQTPATLETVSSLLASITEDRVPSAEAAAYLRGYVASWVRQREGTETRAVWSGPSTPGTPGRSTAQVLTEVGGVNPDGANGLAAHLWTDPTAAAETARVFWSTTPKARTFKLSVAADKLAPRVNTKGKLTIDTDKAAWNPGLVEFTVLGCHPEDGDSPEALALAAHQLRQAPDLPDALSLPLPLHLAGLAQEYVLPTQAGEEEPPSADAAADTDPDAGAAPGLAGEPEPQDAQGQLSLFDAAAQAPQS